jgi:hypothetical protein
MGETDRLVTLLHDHRVRGPLAVWCAENGYASPEHLFDALAPAPDPLREDAQADWITPSGPLDKDPI